MMIPFQQTRRRIGQISQEAYVEKQWTDEPPFHGLPLPDAESIFPSSIEFAMDAGAECSSYNASPAAAHLSLGGAVSPTHLEPISVVQPDQLFGVEDDYGQFGLLRPDRSGMMFDDLPPEAFDFFELPPSPSLPPIQSPPPSPSARL
ncbi:hypothetical protein ABZP36_024602 [Zizania latifolia]